MRLQDILFIGMDIPREAYKILNSFTGVTTGMTEGELKAYDMGIKNALNVVRMLCEEDEHIVFHLDGNDCSEEFDLDELIEIVEEKEGY